MTEEIVIQRETPKPADAAALDEERVRGYLKEKYGIEEDPETFRSTRQKEREAYESLPKYQQALATAHQILTGNVRRPETQSDVVADRPAVVDDEERLRERARIDPYEVMKEVLKKERESNQTLLARHARGTEEIVANRLKYEQSAQSSLDRMAADYPEAFDEKTPLFQEGMSIFWKEMSDIERRLPNAALRATEVAAGRLGLKPKSRRVADDPLTTRDEVAAQHPERGSRKPRAEDEGESKLTAKDKDIAKEMGITEEGMKQAKQARAERKNLRVE